MWPAASSISRISFLPNLPLPHTFAALLKNKAMSSTETTVTESQLFRACKRGDLPTVRRAVAEGLEVKNAVNKSFFNYTPLHYASEYEN